MSAAVNLEQAKQFVDHLNALGMAVIDKAALNELIANAKKQETVPLSHKWITRKQAKEIYGVTVHWLNQQMNDPKTLLKVDPGKFKRSTMKYNEQSLVNELERLSV